MGIKGHFKNTAFVFENEVPDVLVEYTEEGELYNQSNLLFMEEEYLDKCSLFSSVSDKLKIKKFNKELSIYKNNSIEKVLDYSLDNELYNKVIEINNIDGVLKRDLNISIKHFHVYEKSKKIIFIQNLYILLFLSNVTRYTNNTFEFIVETDENEVMETVSFESNDEIDLFSIYGWVVESKENFKTRLQIIRGLIVKKKTFRLTLRDLLSAKSAFNRIIKEETDRYFSQVNMLKDDFLKISEWKQKNYQSLHLKFLGWCSAIALFIYEEIKDRKSGSIMNSLVTSKSEKALLFLIIFMISLIVIWIIFLKEMDANKKEFDNLNELYTRELFFEQKDFESYFIAPRISCAYIAAFILIIAVLTFRLMSFLF